MTGQPSRRLFFALWPDELTRARLAEPVRDAARLLRRPAKLAAPANLHITLAFLGNVDEAALSGIRNAARSISAAPIGLRVDRWGRFGKSGILYLAPRNVPAELSDFVSRLWGALAECGFESEKRTFRPHITVARKVSLQVELPAPAGVWWQAVDFALVESEPGATGPVYTVLERWPLAAEAT